jgi:hypothetical protein
MSEKGHGWREAVNDGLQRGWLALLLLGALPAVHALPSQHQAYARAVLLLIALALWAGTIARRPAWPRGIALLAQSTSATIGAWEKCLLVFAAVVAIVYMVVASRVVEITYNDGAYYYGVARHIAVTGRLEEPIVWHFLHPPDRIVHAPFDYWGSMTSLLLVPPFVVFGATPRIAFLTMGAISSASLLTFWYLVCIALPLRHFVTQLLALAIFAFSPAMDVYRFQPESIAVAQLFILCALIAFCRRRSVLALLCGFGIFLTRSDAVILFALIFLAAIWQERTERAGDAWAWWTPVAGMTCVAAYMLWSFFSFGTLAPPASQALPFLPSYEHVYDYGVQYQRSPSDAGWFTPTYLASRVRLAFDTMRSIPFTPASNWWLAMAAVGLFTLRGRGGGEKLICLLFIGYFVLVSVNGPGFAPFRTPYTFTPLVILVGALGIDALLSLVHAWSERARSYRVCALAVGAGVFAGCAALLLQLPALQRYPVLGNLPFQGDLTELDAVIHGAAVASNVPWYMIAYTQSPTVSVPFNGEDAIAEVLARYHVSWMVLARFPPPWGTGGSRAVLDQILAGKRTEVGGFRLERVPVNIKQDVYRVISNP